jgi:hypothetical protein
VVVGDGVAVGVVDPERFDARAHDGDWRRQ